MIKGDEGEREVEVEGSQGGWMGMSDGKLDCKWEIIVKSYAKR